MAGYSPKNRTMIVIKAVDSDSASSNVIVINRSNGVINDVRELTLLVSDDDEVPQPLTVQADTIRVRQCTQTCTSAGHWR
jgi:hypothetical protein